MRRRDGARYVWLLQPVEIAGSTRYDAREAKVTPDPAPFAETEPAKPSDRISTGLFKDRKRTPEEMTKANDEWRTQYNEWDRKRIAHETLVRTGPCRWERTLARNSAAKARVALRLIDLDNNGRVVWEREAQAAETSRADTHTERVTVRGFKSVPPPLETPPAEDDCPAALKEDAARAAGKAALALLAETAWLPEAGVAPAARSRRTQKSQWRK